jgi:DNA-binding transcriptional ArsR family regulator
LQTVSVPLHHSLRELSHPVRVEIIAILAAGPLTVNELCAKLDHAQPNASHHLAELRAIGIVSVRRDRVYRHYSLNPSTVMTVATQLVDLLSAGGAA